MVIYRYEEVTSAMPVGDRCQEGPDAGMGPMRPGAKTRKERSLRGDVSSARNKRKGYMEVCMGIYMEKYMAIRRII